MVPDRQGGDKGRKKEELIFILGCNGMRLSFILTVFQFSELKISVRSCDQLINSFSHNLFLPHPFF